MADPSQKPSINLKCVESFGFDCAKRRNLATLPKSGNMPATLAMISGSSLLFRSLNDTSKTVRDNINMPIGVGISSIAVHPEGHRFAVGEKREDNTQPVITIYSWPEVEKIGELVGASEKAVAFMTFSPVTKTRTGDLLASVGSSPDFMLTLWNWQEQKIVLRSKAYGQDVYSVAFNPHIEGQLCSSGVGHIKFWTMANTFTGLKLQGELGRFGRTAISDVEAFVQLPDGRVLSGSEWGNILLWDGGLISLEICQSDGSNCHNGNIRWMSLDESGELLTAGEDGTIKVWNAEAILEIDAGELEGGMLKYDCMNTLTLPSKAGSDISHLVRFVNDSKNADEDLNRSDHDEDHDEENLWLAQDAKGSVWNLDLSFSHKSKPPKAIYTSHAGLVNDFAINEVSELMASAGDSFILIYNLRQKENQNSNIVADCELSYPAHTITWRGKRHLVAGHDDGCLRLYAYNVNSSSSGRDNELIIVQALKPHIDSITKIYTTEDNKYILSASKDKTIFIYKCTGQEGGWLLETVGFLTIEGVATEISFSTDNFSCFIGTDNGHFYNFDLSPIRDIDTNEKERFTYKLDYEPIQHFTFKSCKDQLLRETVQKEAEEERNKLLKKKQAQLKAKKDSGETFTSDQEIEFLNVPAVEVDDSPFFMPEKPSAINTIWSCTSDESEYCISLSGYDAGFLYRVDGKNGKVKDAFRLDTEKAITSYKRENGVMFLAFENGIIRAYSANGTGLLLLPKEFSEVSGILQQHDLGYGKITKIETFGANSMISSGLDGNIFRYTLSGNDLPSKGIKVPRPVSHRLFNPVKDIDKDAWSIEQQREKEEEAKNLKLAEKRKDAKKEQILQLQKEFIKLSEINENLPDLARVADVSIADDIIAKQDDTTEKKSREAQLNVVRQNLLPATIEREVSVQQKEKHHIGTLVYDKVILSDFNNENSVENYKLKDVFDLEFKDEYEQLRKMLKSRCSTGMDSLNDSFDEDGEDRESELGFDADGLGRKSTRMSTFKRLNSRRMSRAKSIAGKGAPLNIKNSAAWLKMTKEEKRQYEKKQRKEELDRLMANKPDISKTDPRDEAEMDEARAQLGDLKLKTSEDYVVPEGKRANADQKRMNLMEQEIEIYKKSYHFDKYIQLLNEEKANIISATKAAVQEIQKLQKFIPENERSNLPKVPIQSALETPQARYIPEEKRILEFFGKIGPNGQISGKIEKNNVKKLSSNFELEFEPDFMSSNENTGTVFGVDPDDPFPTDDDPEDSDFASSSDPADLSPWRHSEISSAAQEQHKILQNIQSRQNFFNQEIIQANYIKSVVQVHVGAGRLAADMLLQESWLLENFEHSEQNLEDRVQAKLKDVQEAKMATKEAENRREDRQHDMIEGQNKLNDLDEEFNNILPDNQKAADWLTKVYKKKIKRKKDKKKTEREDGNGSDEDSSDMSDSDSDFSDDDFSSEGESEKGSVFDENVRPAQISQEVYDRCLGGFGWVAQQFFSCKELELFNELYIFMQQDHAVLITRL